MLKRRRQGGFTLIEVLIAVLVLGIGLLGVAGLQSVALGLNYGSYLRSQGTLFARDIADRMRANHRGVDNGAYDMGTGASPTEQSACESTGGCNSNAMAAHDLFEWTQNLADSLPDGQGVVCIDDTPVDGTPGSPACDGSGDNYAIKIWWYDRQNETSQRFVTVFRP